MSKRASAKSIKRKTKDLQISDAFNGDIADVATRMTIDIYKTMGNSITNPKKELTLQDIIKNHQFNDAAYEEFIQCNNINKTLLTTPIKNFQFDDYLCLIGLTISYVTKITQLAKNLIVRFEINRKQIINALIEDLTTILRSVHKYDNILSYYQRVIMLVKNRCYQYMFWDQEQTLNVEITTNIQNFKINWWIDFVYECLSHGQKMIDLYIDYTYGHPSSKKYAAMIFMTTRAEQPIDLEEEEIFQFYVKARLLGTLSEKKPAIFVNSFVGYIMSIYLTSISTMSIYFNGTISCDMNVKFTWSVAASKLFKFLCNIRKDDVYKKYRDRMVEMLNNDAYKNYAVRKAEMSKDDDLLSTTLKEEFNQICQSYDINTRDQEYVDLAWYSMYVKNYNQNLVFFSSTDFYKMVNN